MNDFTALNALHNVEFNLDPKLTFFSIDPGVRSSRLGSVGSGAGFFSLRRSSGG